MADAQRRLLDFARRSVAPFSLFRRTLCSLRIPHGTPPKREQHPLFPFWLRAIDGSEPCGETLLQARRLLRDFARIDRHIAAGSAACTARRLRPFPYARGGNGNTQNRNTTAVSSLMAHIPHGANKKALRVSGFTAGRGCGKIEIYLTPAARAAAAKEGSWTRKS